MNDEALSFREREIASALPAELDSLPRLSGFRLRGLDMTRLETFVDATFAFAITMLVIAGQQVPDRIDVLLDAFKNVPAFAASVASLAIFWRGHWLWSRRYGLEDGFSIVISWALIFTMLIYVYPLKIIFSAMFYAISGHRVGQFITAQTIGQIRALFAVYALGFIALALEIILLNVRAWRLRKALRLNPLETALTRMEIIGWSIPAGVGTLSLVCALTLAREHIDWAGWCYFLMSLLIPIYRSIGRKKLQALRAKGTITD
ncbi:MAG TPA: TMEM175 family protein [Chthoniobacterales bacterium]|nr:TMEM175 family protein [Chthoniobacterales bacterium]